MAVSSLNPSLVLKIFSVPKELAASTTRKCWAHCRDLPLVRAFLWKCPGLEQCLKDWVTELLFGLFTSQLLHQTHTPDPGLVTAVQRHSFSLRHGGACGSGPALSFYISICHRYTVILSFHSQWLMEVHRRRKWLSSSQLWSTVTVGHPSSHCWAPTELPPAALRHWRVEMASRGNMSYGSVLFERCGFGGGKLGPISHQ